LVELDEFLTLQKAIKEVGPWPIGPFSAQSVQPSFLCVADWFLFLVPAGNGALPFEW
jgi:hypothetical protein